MSNEEEAMELSGESNLVSNLHNFSFNVSWANSSRDLETQHHSFRPHAPNILSPAKFLAASTPNRHSWKALNLREKSFTSSQNPTVKLSQKTVATYHDADQEECSRRQSYSPMELDHSGTSFGFENSGSKKTKRQSDFGVSYFNKKSKDVPKMKNIVEDSQDSQVRKRSVKNSSVHDSSLEDSVFFRNSKTSHKYLDENETYKKTFPTRSTTRSGARHDAEDSSLKSTILFILAGVTLTSCIGGYLYLQIGWCAVFDVDTVKLSHKLEDNVFGQHIAVKSVVEALEKFKKDVRDRNRKRSLVLSFHGWTGIGKNYVSKFISEAFYNAKVSLYLAPLHLMDRHGNEKQNGSVGIKSWIMGNITRCGVNVIIIDEIDKAETNHLLGVESVIDTLNKNWRTVTDGVVKMGPITVFLFLSNSRASQINHYLFSQMLIERERGLIRKSEFDDIFEKSEFEWYESMKSKNMIDHFIPFLPLTETHVKQCIERDFVKKGRDPSESLIMSVMEELSFVDMGGKDGQVSLTGCKRVQDKVNLHIDD